MNIFLTKTHLKLQIIFQKAQTRNSEIGLVHVITPLIFKKKQSFMKTYICFLSFVVLLSSCEQELNFEKIKHETIYQKLQPAHKSKYLSESWIVHNYRDNEAHEAKIDDFVCTYVDTISNPYGSLSLTFYKYSRRYTNMEVLARRPDNISESMSHDYLWHYTFNKNGFSGKTKVKNVKNHSFFYPEPECLMNKE